MAKYAVLNDSNIVVDILEADSALESGWILITASNSTDEFPADIGATYDSGADKFTRPSNTAAENEALAKKLLEESDWAILDDIGLTGANVDEWKSYRSTIRGYIKTPQAGNVSWPTKPNAEYS